VYCGGDSDVTVIDPKADTVTEVLPVKWCRMLCSVPGVNKVYAVSYNSSGDMELAVIDCKNDTVARTIPLPTYYVWSMCHVSTTGYDKLYFSADGEVLIVDCIADTLVRSYPSGYSYVAAGCDGKRVYCATMDSLCTFDPAGDTLVASVPWDIYNLGCPFYVPDVDKVYCVCTRPGGQHCILVADGATDSITGQISLHAPAPVYYDAASKLVYIRYDDSMIAFADSRTDSVISSLSSQVQQAAVAVAPPHHRLYVGPFSGYIASSSMPVIRTDPPGVEETSSAEVPAAKPGPTVVRDILYLPAALGAERGASSVLLDIAGRVAMRLQPGANDVRALAPGVYFVRDAQAQAVRKVVKLK
jgi:DNA-binding beta-propeller fold protein YncE